VPVRFNSHTLGVLSSDPGSDVVSISKDHTHTEEWTLEDAGDHKYYIASPDHKHLVDVHGHLTLSPNKDGWETFSIIDGSSGQAFIKTHRDMFLQDAHGALQAVPNADNWEKWWVHDTEGYPACRFETANLFCFLVTRSWGHEMEMVKHMNEKQASVFSCDDAMVFSDTAIKLGEENPFWTTQISHDILKHDAGVYENHHLFEQVWSYVWHEGRYHHADWVIKTDPDTVFIPNRLRSRLGGSSHAKNHDTFYANCGTSPADAHMYGPLEVFSAHAVEKYYGGWWNKCRHNVKLQGGDWFEEKYMTECLKNVGVAINPFLNLDLLSDPHCDPALTAPDCKSNAAAMHPVKTVEEWDKCWQDAHHGEDGHD